MPSVSGKGDGVEDVIGLLLGWLLYAVFFSLASCV